MTLSGERKVGWSLAAAQLERSETLQLLPHALSISIGSTKELYVDSTMAVPGEVKLHCC